jgi:hypothetical protein
MLKPLVAAGLLMLAACANDYVPVDKQACIAQALIDMQADPAAADLRMAQKAALIADACGISADAIILKAAE